MIIVVPDFYHIDIPGIKFTITEGLYKSVCGNYQLIIDDVSGEEINSRIVQEGIKFKLWKYKNWLGEWVEYKGK